MSQRYENSIVIENTEYTLNNFTVDKNIFLNYCYLQSSKCLGKRRIFKKIVEHDNKIISRY